MELTAYKTPSGEGTAEITEKRSRFIGFVAPADTEDAAKSVLTRVRTEHRDARHNCWCYILRSGAERYSDDGEPQGSAGLPMLEIFRRGAVFDVVCVVTRYFGGILLGTGGLSRAYSETAKLALENAGTAELTLWECMELVCHYNLLGRVKAELEVVGGMVDGIEYLDAVIMRVRFRAGQADAIGRRLADITSGAVIGRVTGTRYA